YADYLQLHPLPTRRSSDLRDEGFGERGARFEELGEAPQRDLEDAALLARPDHVDVEAGERSRVVLGERLAERRAAAHAVEQVGRSEEHTSELQSRVDLVCR